MKLNFRLLTIHSNDRLDYHYFISSHFGWNMNENIQVAIAKRLKLDAKYKELEGYHAKIYLIPGTVEETNYPIVDYTPRAFGSILIGELKYGQQ